MIDDMGIDCRDLLNGIAIRLAASRRPGDDKIGQLGAVI
jgi:hypothetical protein